MSCFRPVLTIPLLLALAAPACSERNPIYHADQGTVRRDGAVTADRSVSPDGPVLPPDRGAVPDRDPTVDWGAPPDLGPAPDTAPWTCTTNAQCDDGIFCTTDLCTAQKICKNTLISGACLINKTCYKKGETAPGNTCSVCEPTVSVSAWAAKADGLACSADTLSCTVDACKAGKCVATPQTGFCVVGGACIKDGAANPQNGCEVCQTKASATSYTFAAGKPCSAGSGLVGGLCLASKCRGFASTTYEPQQNGLRETILTDVAYIDSDKKVWAGGNFEFRVNNQTTERGLFVDLAGLMAKQQGAVQQVDRPVRDLHTRLAVGTSGRAWYHDGSKWVTAAPLQTLLGGQERYALWGRDDGQKQHYYIGGPTVGLVPAIASCVFTPSSTSGPIGTFQCVPHTGVSSSTPVGYLFGTVGASGGQGPLWAMIRGNNTPEDIYYNPGTGTSWSMKGPQGCEDTGNNPCGNTSSETYNFGGSGADDVWLVGSAGMIIHYDGKKWTAMNNVVSNQSNLYFSAVYSDATEKVTLLAAYRGGMGSADIYLYAYNRKTGTWYGPSNVATSGIGSQTFIYDMGGKDLSDLWMVGAREPSGWNQREQGWVLQLK